MLQLGFSKGQPHSGPQTPEQKAHLGTLAPGLSSAVRALCMQQICCTDVKARTGGPHTPQTVGNLGLWGFLKRPSCPLGPREGSLPAPIPAEGSPRWNTGTNKERSCGPANGEALPKRDPSQSTKMEKGEKKNLLGRNLFRGSVFLSTGNLHAMETNPRGPVSAY